MDVEAVLPERRPAPPSTTPRPIRPRRTRRAIHSGSSRGIQASSHSCSPGPRYDRPSPAAPPGQLHVRAPARRRRPTSSVGWVLPEHQGRAVPPHGRPPAAAARLGTARRRRARRREGKPQDAAARYGSHNGSTSDRCRNRQRCPSGGAGFTLSVQPSSESKLVRLDQVVALAGGDDVGPVVGATSAARDHVVDGVGGLRAVDAEPAVTAEHGSPGHGRGAGPAWDAHHVGEPDDRRHVDRQPGGVEDRAVLADGDGLGSSRQHQNDGTTIRDEGQRLVGRIEEEHPLHTPERLSAAGPRPLTPAQVGHHVARGQLPRLAVPAVGGHEAEAPVGLPRQGQEGGTVPPPPPGHPAQGAGGGPPQPGRGTTARSTTLASRPQRRAGSPSPTLTPPPPPRTARPGRRRRAGHGRPTRPGTTRAPRANAIRHSRSISAWAARKKGRRNPAPPIRSRRRATGRAGSTTDGDGPADERAGALHPLRRGQPRRLAR